MRSLPESLKLRPSCSVIRCEPTNRTDATFAHSERKYRREPLPLSPIFFFRGVQLQHKLKEIDRPHLKNYCFLAYIRVGSKIIFFKSTLYLENLVAASFPTLPPFHKIRRIFFPSREEKKGLDI